MVEGVSGHLEGDMIPSDSTEALPLHDLDALGAAIRTLLALEVKAPEIQAILTEAKAPPAAWIEALVILGNPSNPMQVASALSRAADRDDLWPGLLGACRRWKVHPASLVALETRRPLALGVRLGLPNAWIRSFPGKRRAQKDDGFWTPPSDFLNQGLPNGLVLRELVLCDQPRLNYLPERLWVSDRIALDRLPHLVSLGSALEAFEGRLDIRDCPALPRLPPLEKLRELQVDGQPWVRFPEAPLKARQISLQRMLGLEALDPGLHARKLTLTLCPSLRELPLLTHLQEAPPEPKRSARRTQESDPWMPNLASTQHGLTLTACHALRSLPPGFRISGTLTLQDCWGFVALPPDLEVRHLVLRRLPSLRHLPAGMHVRGHLVLDGLANLESLPKGLVVDGDLVVHQTLLPMGLADDLVVRGRIRLQPTVARLPWPNRPKVLPDLRVLDYL